MPKNERCPPHYCDNQGLCHYCGMIMEPEWWAAYNEPFTLENVPRKPTEPPLFDPLPKAKQRPLLRGLNDAPGQLDLWEGGHVS